jgi:hypothetical protein
MMTIPIKTTLLAASLTLWNDLIEGMAEHSAV